MGPRGKSDRIAVFVSVFVLLAGCSAGAPRTPSPGPVATPAHSPTPVPTAADSPSTSVPPAPTSPPATTRTEIPLPAPSASTAPAASRLRWIKAGQIDVGDGELLGLVRLEQGYVAWGHAYPDGADPDEGQWALATWTSTDLRSWTRTLHRFPVTWCPGWAPGQETDQEAASADGTTLVIVVDHPIPDPSAPDGCNQAEGLSLSTHDGRTWIRSAPLPTLRQMRPWRVPDGWEVHAGPIRDGVGVSVWQTDDLLTWREVGQAPSLSYGGGVMAVSADGTRLIESEGAPGRWLLLTSSDGVRWKQVRTLANGSTPVGALAPETWDRRWVVFVDEASGGVRLLFSKDLKTWSRSTFPRGGLGQVLRTPDGWLAVGYAPDPPGSCEENEAGNLICPGAAAPPTYRGAAVYHSSDGQTWIKHPRSLLPGGGIPDFIADGAHVLAIPFAPDGRLTGTIDVWRLQGTP